MCRYTDIRDPSSEQCRALCHVLKQRWLWVMKGGALLPYSDLLIQGGAGPFQCRIPAVFPKANARAQNHGGVPALSVWAGFSSPSFVSSVESTTSSKHWLSLEFAALWKLLIAKLLRCLLVSLLRFLCVLSLHLHPILALCSTFCFCPGMMFQSCLQSSRQRLVFPGSSVGNDGAFPIWDQQPACDFTHNNGFF